MLLEDIGIPQQAFMELQNEVIKKIEKIDTSIDNFVGLLRQYNLGNSFGLQEVLNRLKRRYQFDLKPNARDTRLMDNPFWKHLREVVSTTILRDIKHSARIYVPDAYLLVGVPDEGPAYEYAGYENVFTLKAGEVFSTLSRLSLIDDHTHSNSMHTKTWGRGTNIPFRSCHHLEESSCIPW